tara:strand:+ start:72 stop:305 length:234 start_codon:yes stop_codon:yes gene_type:complete
MQNKQPKIKEIINPIKRSCLNSSLHADLLIATSNIANFSFGKNPKLNSPVIEKAGDDNKIIIKNINLLLDKLNIYSE